MTHMSVRRIRQLFELRGGKLYWKVRRSGVRVGAEAGHLRRDGYRTVCFAAKLQHGSFSNTGVRAL